MKHVLVRGAPTLCAVALAIVAHYINFPELKSGALTAAGVLLVVAVVFGWPE